MKLCECERPMCIYIIWTHYNKNVRKKNGEKNVITNCLQKYSVITICGILAMELFRLAFNFVSFSYCKNINSVFPFFFSSRVFKFFHISFIVIISVGRVCVYEKNTWNSIIGRTTYYFTLTFIVLEKVFFFLLLLLILYTIFFLFLLLWLLYKSFIAFSAIDIIILLIMLFSWRQHLIHYFIYYMKGKKIAEKAEKDNKTTTIKLTHTLWVEIKI